MQFKKEELLLIAGPCVIEDEDIVYNTAEVLLDTSSHLGISFIFKTSYDKANRSSLNSYRGVGLKKGIEIFSALKKRYKDIVLLTDVHCQEEIKEVAGMVDVLQIPAFLSRQTDLLITTARYAKAVNIKKAQFMSPYEMKFAVEKIKSTGNDNILITERGSCFGYNNLVVDFRSFVILQELNYPVIFDATHSLQYPGRLEDSTGGEIRFLEYLAKAAIATGAVNGLFLEVHPSPNDALCDKYTQLPLGKLPELLTKIKQLHDFITSIKGDNKELTS